MAAVLPTRQPWQLFREQRWLVLGLVVLWNVFVVVEFARRWYLNDYWGAPSEASIATIPRLIYHYYPWIIISLGIGWFVQARPVFGQTAGSRWLKNSLWHVAAAMLIAVAFGAWAALAYWVFSPELVARVTFGYVFIEQYLKWLPLITLVYAGIAGLWTLALFRVSTTDNRFNTDQRTILVSMGSKTIPVPVAEILWIEADDNYVHLHTPDKSYIHREALKNLENRLASAGFYRTHRSALVNLLKIQSLDAQQVHFQKGPSAPLSRRNKRGLKQRLDHANHT